MNKLLQHLIEIDELAADFYSKALTNNLDDQNAYELFADLRKSRVKSRKFLIGAIKDMTIKTPATFGKSFAKSLSQEYSLAYNKITTLVQKPKTTIKELLECTIELEISKLGKCYSEVINTLKEDSRAFISVAAMTQLRRRLLEIYIANTYEHNHHIPLFEDLPKLWTENLLVADDSMATATLLADTLSGEGSVYTAGNGISAMRKLNKKYFAAIISDVSMPIMGGVDLYREAEKKFPGIGKRFIFFTDTASMYDIDFFKINKINYLPKPSSINAIRRAVLKIMCGVS